MTTEFWAAIAANIIAVITLIVLVSRLTREHTQFKQQQEKFEKNDIHEFDLRMTRLESEMRVLRRDIDKLEKKVNSKL